MGAKAQGARLDAALLRDLLAILVQGAQGAVRLRVEGRSRASGPPPEWLQQAAHFDFVELQAGSTRAIFESPPLWRAAPLFEQRPLFKEFDEEASAIQLMVESLQDAVHGHADSELFDPPLLKTFAGFRTLLGRNLDAVEISNGDPRLYARVTCKQLEPIRELLRTTPPPQRVRLAGHLDMIRDSDRMYTLRLEDGTSVKGVAEEIHPELLKDHWGSLVSISGMATFRPSGRVLRIETESVESATTDDLAVWSHPPRPTFASTTAPIVLREQTSRSGINALIGQWPGNETEEEFLAALDELS